jgi:hypothetical protein
LACATLKEPLDIVTLVVEYAHPVDMCMAIAIALATFML